MKNDGSAPHIKLDGGGLECFASRNGQRSGADSCKELHVLHSKSTARSLADTQAQSPGTRPKRDIPGYPAIEICMIGWRAQGQSRA
jgi:hypothetical protein